MPRVDASKLRPLPRTGGRRRRLWLRGRLARADLAGPGLRGHQQVPSHVAPRRRRGDAVPARFWTFCNRKREDKTPSLRLIPLIVAALATAGIAGSALGQTIAADVPLPTGSERVLLSAPAQPRAVLIMLPGGDGIVDIGQNRGRRPTLAEFLGPNAAALGGARLCRRDPGRPDNRSQL